MTTDLAALIVRMQSDNEDDAVDAFTELIQQLHNPIYCWLAGYCADPVRREDLMQEVWVSVCQHLERIEVASSAEIRAYIYRIACNVARSEGRRLGSQAAHLGKQVSIDDVDPGSHDRVSKAEQIEFAERRNRIVRQIFERVAQFNERQQAVFFAKFTSDGYQWTHRIPEMTEGAAKIAWHRIKNTLRAEFGDDVRELFADEPIEQQKGLDR